MREVHMDESLPSGPPDGGGPPPHVDDMTGLQLQATLARSARREEIASMVRLGIFEALGADELCNPTQRALPSRFVDVDKGEPGAHVIQSRLVVCETRSLSRGLSSADPFSATPPHEAPRMVRLLKCRYGLRDTSRPSDSHLENILKDMGLSVGAHCPC